MSAPYLEWWDSADASLVSATISSNQNAGDTVAAVVRHLFNDKGATHSSTTLRNARLVAEAWDGLNWVRDGEPAVDEGWLQVSLTGQDSTGDASMVVQTTAFTALGANRSQLLRDIPANCARYISSQIVIPAGTSQSAPRMRLVVVYDETSFPLGARTVYATGGGVVPEYRDASSRRLTSASLITASGLATVAVAERAYSYDGKPYLAPPATPTLNQTSASGALAAGESYIAVLSQSGFISPGITTTKGNKAVSPVAPAMPAGDILVGKVTVAFQGGGTSIINQGNVDQTGVVRGDYVLHAGTGLNAIIGSGHALFSSSDTESFNTAASTIALTDNIYNHVFILTDGTFTKSTTGSAPKPDISVFGAAYVGAIYLGYALTAGGVVTSVVLPSNSERAEPAITEYIMEFRYYGQAYVQIQADAGVLPFDAFLDTVDVGSHVAGSGAGSTKIDININNITIYTSQATWDQRPTFASGISSLGNRLHELRGFFKGQIFTLDIDAVQATAPIDLFVTLHFRRW